MSEWQPIETAPRDGTPILGCCADGEMHVYFPQQYGSNNQFDGWDVRYDNEGCAPFPDYWRPLPSPPVST